ncbi:MAG: hypothetical protein IJ022_06230 [Burkholderiaceae bacterium]|nr:hypothetical protein [Burkholderiaceae bacterium]
MGWLISLAIILVCLFSKHTISPDVMFIVAGLFAIAGSIGSTGSSISNSLKREKESDSTK